MPALQTAVGVARMSGSTFPWNGPDGLIQVPTEYTVWNESDELMIISTHSSSLDTNLVFIMGQYPLVDAAIRMTRLGPRCWQLRIGGCRPDRTIVRFLMMFGDQSDHTTTEAGYQELERLAHHLGV